jgi:hypothetical protein
MPKLKNDKHETKDCNQILNNCIHELENMTSDQVIMRNIDKGIDFPMAFKLKPVRYHWFEVYTHFFLKLFWIESGIICEKQYLEQKNR